MADLEMPQQAYFLWEVGQYPTGILLATGCSQLAIHPIGAGNFHLEIGLSLVDYSQCSN